MVIYSIKGLAELLGYSASTIRDAVRTGKLVPDVDLIGDDKPLFTCEQVNKLVRDWPSNPGRGRPKKIEGDHPPASEL